MTRKIILLALVALLALTGCAAAQLLDRTDPTPTPAPTVTVTAEPVEVEVEKTPDSCLRALDLADEGFDITFRVFGYFGPAIQAVLDMNLSKMNQINRKIRKATKRMGKIGPKYNAAKAECKAGA